MLRAVIVLCALVGGSLSQSPEEYACKMRENQSCNPPRSRDFPKTKEDMDNFCREGISALKCLNKGATKCSGEHNREVKHMRQIISLLETKLCNNDSYLYRTVSNNLQCMGKEVQKYDQCRGDNLEEKKKIMLKVVGNPLAEDLDLQPMVLETCMHRMFHFACGAAMFEKACGKAVGDAFAEISLVADPEFDTCPREVKDQLHNAIDALRSDTGAEEEAANDIEMRKK